MSSKKMIHIDDMIQGSIERKTWDNLPPIKKIRIYKLANDIHKIVHSEDKFL